MGIIEGPLKSLVEGSGQRSWGMKQVAIVGVKVDLLANTPVGGAEAPGSKGSLSIKVSDPTWPRPLAGPPAASSAASRTRSGPLCMTKCWKTQKKERPFSRWRRAPAAAAASGHMVLIQNSEVKQQQLSGPTLCAASVRHRCF